MENLFRSEFKKTPEDEHDLKVLAKRSVFGRYAIMQQAKLVYEVMPADYKLVIDFYNQQPKSYTLEKI